MRAIIKDVVRTESGVDVLCHFDCADPIVLSFPLDEHLSEKIVIKAIENHFKKNEKEFSVFNNLAKSLKNKVIIYQE